MLYEYHDKTERKRAAEEDVDKESDKIEDERLEANLSWAEEEERREMEELKAKQEAEQKKKDKAWMEEQLKKEKEKFGEDFGEDLTIDF